MCFSVCVYVCMHLCICGDQRTVPWDPLVLPLCAFQRLDSGSSNLSHLSSPCISQICHLFDIPMVALSGCPHLAHPERKLLSLPTSPESQCSSGRLPTLFCQTPKLPPPCSLPRPPSLPGASGSSGCLGWPHCVPWARPSSHPMRACDYLPDTHQICFFTVQPLKSC